MDKKLVKLMSEKRISKSAPSLQNMGKKVLEQLGIPEGFHMDNRDYNQIKPVIFVPGSLVRNK